MILCQAINAFMPWNRLLLGSEQSVHAMGALEFVPGVGCFQAVFLAKNRSEKGFEESFCEICRMKKLFQKCNPELFGKTFSKISEDMQKADLVNKLKRLHLVKLLLSH